MNGHISHIDSPETDTYPTSDVVQGESLMDDISSMIGEMLYGYDQDSVADTYTDDTTLFQLGKFCFFFLHCQLTLTQKGN